jgi:hypothetical protein
MCASLLSTYYGQKRHIRPRDNRQILRFTSNTIKSENSETTFSENFGAVIQQSQFHESPQKPRRHHFNCLRSAILKRFLRPLSVFRFPPRSSSKSSTMFSIDQMATGRADGTLGRISDSVGLCTSEVCLSRLCPDARFRFRFSGPDVFVIS